MNKYVVAFWSDHTGELLQEEVEAKSEFDAAVSYLQVDPVEFKDMEAIHDYCVNGDSTINVLQIDKKNWRHAVIGGPAQVTIQ